MTVAEATAQLEAWGTEQNRKTYRRHGVGGELFGVSYANLNQLKKKLKVDHALARELWATGNHDARILATMIADPRQLDAATADAWAGDLDNDVVAGAFAGVVGRSSLAREKMEAWTRSEEEWLGSAGWVLLGCLAMGDGELPDAFFEPYLETIEREIHAAKNRVRYAMNNALIAIGMRSDALEAQAIAAAGRIGKVVVDHGETGCKTPDAAAYIRKARARRR
jgi:3-methyladenine DNA glycosylase AlkD